MGLKMDAGHAGGSMRQGRGRYSKDTVREMPRYAEKLIKTVPFSR
jgi:hypothetical protein